MIKSLTPVRYKGHLYYLINQHNIEGTLCRRIYLVEAFGREVNYGT